MTKTDDKGRFEIDVLTMNRPLVNKHASILAFKPSWNSERIGTPIASSIAWLAPAQPILMSHIKAERFTSRLSISLDSASELPAIERTYSNELFNALRVAADGVCGSDGYQLTAIAMDHALAVSKTFNERLRVRASCRAASLRIESHKALRRTRHTWFLRSEPEYQWPFDCENLPFKHQPSADVLAVEAELASKRRGL